MIKIMNLGILENHKSSCKCFECILREGHWEAEFIDINRNINIKKIEKILNNFFSIYLNLPLFKNNRKEREYLSLKYYSFLGKF